MGMVRRNSLWEGFRGSLEVSTAAKAGGPIQRYIQRLRLSSRKDASRSTRSMAAAYTGIYFSVYTVLKRLLVVLLLS
jgi:hypothetical protein